MKCQRCQSERVASITAKCGDCCGVRLGLNESESYVPRDMGIGGGDYVEFYWCMNCGQLQGTFPIASCNMEKTVSDVDIIEFFENHFSEGELIREPAYSARNGYRRIIYNEAEEISPKFERFVKEFLENNSGGLFPSPEDFVALYKENNPFLSTTSP